MKTIETLKIPGFGKDGVNQGPHIHCHENAKVIQPPWKILLQ